MLFRPNYNLQVLVVLATFVFPCLELRGQSIDIHSFKSMQPTARLSMIHNYPYWKSDTATIVAFFGQLLPAALETGDQQTIFALKFQQFRQRNTLKLSQPAVLDLLFDMEKQADGMSWDVEKIVAHHYRVFEQYDLKQISTEQLYAEVLNTFDGMKQLGFHRFEDYHVDAILYELGQFMYMLDDIEQMFNYLSIAEQHIHYTESGQYHALLVLNYLESYYQRKKNYPKAIEYAQKILNFTQGHSSSHSETEWRRQFWEGFALLEIASMLAEQGNITESEQYADTGYEKSKISYAQTPYTALRGEYDAIQVLLNTKLKLGKLNESRTLIERAQYLLKALESDPKMEIHYFQPLKFYKNCARYYELNGDAANAMRYTHLSQTLQDSLTRRNDAHKYEQIQRRLEAEKYIRQLKLVEREKQFHRWLTMGTLVIFFLVLILVLGWVHRVQYLKRQKEAELEIAKNNLAALSQRLREKSELIENLRLEMNNLASMDQRSEYLEQLTHAVILTEEDWTRFRDLFEKVYPGYISEQKLLNPDLTRAELRLLTLEKLDLHAHEIANILGISTNTVYQTRRRLRIKENTRSN
ncbi:MAG: hypothetical protein IT269_08940 [Saprospiraceae bacterium]|nr:hypothetical protein [Saprospiraceae bacterium]